MNKLCAAGLVLLAVSAATARPVEGERPLAERPVPEAPRAVTRPAVPYPLHPGWVDAEARWMVHLDVESLKASTVGRFVLDHPEEFDLEDLDDFEQEVGLSLLDDVMSITAYGFSDDPETDGIIVAVTTARADEALERLRANPEVLLTEIERDGYVLHAITADDERFCLHLQPADQRDRRIVVLAHSEEALLNALRVIDGAAPSLTPGQSAIVDGGPNRGSILYVGCRGGELFGNEPASEILRLSDGVILDVGEIAGTAYAEARISAASAEAATDIADVVQGIVALGRLVSAEEEEAQPLADLANAVKVAIRDRQITVRVSYDAEKLLWVLGALDEL